MNYSIDKITTPGGQIKYELRIWDSGRKAKQFKRRFSARKQAQDMVDKLLREERHEVGWPTFGNEYQFWRGENDKHFAPGWKANLDGYWSESKDILECVRIDRIETAVAELKPKWAELSQKTINNKMGFVHAVLNFSVEKRRIRFNPLGAYQKPNIQEPDIEFWESSEVENFLSFLIKRYECRDRWRYVAILTVLNTAVRAGELWGLQVGDLKESLGTIRLSRQLNRVTHDFSQLKGKRARSVPLNKGLLVELKRIQTLKKPSTLVFQDGGPINHDVFAEWFDREVDAWGGKRITFHGLRHTAATLMLSAGVDVKSLQEIMGHKNISTTMRYVHALGDSAKRVGERFAVGPKNNVLKLADLG